MKVVRESKFRHVHGEVLKEKYEDLRISAKPMESSGIAASAKFFAFPWESGGGGTLAVIPLSATGRRKGDTPLITGHKGGIMDFEFSPFRDNMLVSASEDMTVKIWELPDDGLKQHMREPLVNLEGHGKKVSFCCFNPSAEMIVASASFDLTCRVWNVSESDEAYKIEVPDQVTHMKWNYNGSVLAATCKDKKLRLIDPRQSNIVSTCKIHQGVKASKVEWIGSATSPEDCYNLITTGFSREAEREVAIWDTRMFKEEEVEPVYMTVVDQGTGAMFPYFDAGTSMLYIVGKGDAAVKYFEITKEDPFLHFVNTLSTTVAQKGFTFLPKRCVQPVPKHEIMRGLKLEANAVSTVSFKVPRKSEIFQEDIFVDCPAPVPAMTADSWTGGAEAKPPRLMSMRPGDESAAQAQQASAGSGIVTMKEVKKQLADALERIKALEKENQSLKDELAKHEKPSS